MIRYFGSLLLLLALLNCKKKNDGDAEKVDRIRGALTGSAGAYDNATAGSWVRVTATEYNNLLVAVNGAAKHACPDILMNNGTSGGWAPNYTVGAGKNSILVPASSYIIALSVRTGASTSTSLGSKLKVSASETTGYTDYGSALPAIGDIPGDTKVYFILKTPVTATPAASGYTALFNASIYFLGNITGGTNGPEYYGTGDVPSLTTPFSSDSYFQVISTQTKDW